MDNDIKEQMKLLFNGRTAAEISEVVGKLKSAIDAAALESCIPSKVSIEEENPFAIKPVTADSVIGSPKPVKKVKTGPNGVVSDDVSDDADFKSVNDIAETTLIQDDCEYIDYYSHTDMLRRSLNQYSRTKHDGFHDDYEQQMNKYLSIIENKYKYIKIIKKLRLKQKINSLLERFKFTHFRFDIKREYEVVMFSIRDLFLNINKLDDVSILEKDDIINNCCLEGTMRKLPKINWDDVIKVEVT